LSGGNTPGLPLKGKGRRERDGREGEGREVRAREGNCAVVNFP